MAQLACHQGSSQSELQESVSQPAPSSIAEAAVPIFPVMSARAPWGPIAIRLSAVFFHTSARMFAGFTSNPPKQAPTVAANFVSFWASAQPRTRAFFQDPRSEEHTSELQSL